MIVHCIRKVDWEAIKDKEFWGEEQLEKEGFIHCSKVEQFDYVAPSFENKKYEFVLLCIEENKLISEVKYEDSDACGMYFPHVYGLINNDSILMVLPFLKDASGHYKRNIELQNK